MHKFPTLAAYLFFLILLISACGSPVIAPTLTPQPSETPTVTHFFTHPLRLYALQFPAGWRQEMVVRGKGVEEVAFTSPDYHISDGYPILENGAEFLVLLKPLAEDTTDSEQYVNANPLLNQLARNRITIEVGGYPAIQFDYSYEGVEAVMTIFIAHGSLFQIRYRYINLAAKAEFLKEYQAMLASLIVYSTQ
jgi:hypothetical protein